MDFSAINDKAKHALAGAAAAAVAMFVYSQLGDPLGLPTQVVGILASLLAGIGKEAKDAYDNWQARRSGAVPVHGVEFADTIATVFGGVGLTLACAVLGVA